MGQGEPPARWAVAGIFFAIVGWLPFGAGSVLAIVFGRRALRQQTRAEDDILTVGTRVGAWLAIGGGLVGAVVVPLYLIAFAGVCSNSQPGGVFGGTRISQVALATVTFAAPPMLVGAIAWVAGRRRVGRGLRAVGVVVLSGLELCALWLALFVLFVAVDGGC